MSTKRLLELAGIKPKNLNEMANEEVVDLFNQISSQAKLAANEQNENKRKMLYYDILDYVKYLARLIPGKVPKEYFR